MFLCVSLNIREEERETLIQNEVGKRLTISLPIFFASFFSSSYDSTESFA